mmetsp:Transcript_63061/g.181393  ORF Transcript_63061/g.181393 Transcript_63061/m.181393 type:complete len:203 (-) Transcript_63061:961-1569(-)
MTFSVGANTLKRSTVKASAYKAKQCAGTFPCASFFVRSPLWLMRSLTMSKSRHLAARCMQVTPWPSAAFKSAPHSRNCVAALTSPLLTAKISCRCRCLVCSFSQFAAKSSTSSRINRPTISASRSVFVTSLSSEVTPPTPPVLVALSSDTAVKCFSSSRSTKYCKALSRCSRPCCAASRKRHAPSMISCLASTEEAKATASI